MQGTSNSITPFDFRGKEVRVIPHGDEFWFLATDVCAALGVTNHRDALGRLDDDEKGVVLTDTLGGKQEVAAVSESGLYSLVLSSRKQVAKPFKRWVTHDVLPALRKTGRYEMAPQPAQDLSPLDLFRQMLTAYEAQESRLQLLEGSQVELEHRLDDTPISAHADKRNHVQKLIQELGNVKGGRAHIGLAYNRYKAHFNLPGKFDALKASDYPEAVTLLTRWIMEAKRDNGTNLYN